MAKGKYTIDEWASHASAPVYRNRAGGTISRSKWHDLFHHRFDLGKTGLAAARFIVIAVK